jgi:DNA-binding transcriptional LysR family regulator
MGLEIRTMRQLLALGEHGSFARAARQLGITQPALSRNVQALEATIGARLFDRGRDGVVPTDVGRLLLDLARPIVNESVEAERQLRQLVSAHTGQIRIGAGPFPADISVGRAVGILSRQSPGFEIDLSVNDWPVIIRSLLNGDIDVGIAEISEAEADDRLDIEPLPRHAGVLFVRHGHPLTGRRGLTLDHVREFPLVLTQIPARLDTLVRRRRTRPRQATPPRRLAPEIRVDTFGLVREIVMSGDAVGGGLRRQIRSDLRARRVEVLPLALPWLTTNYGIIRLAGRTASPLLVEFLNILRRVEDDIAAG